MKAHETKRKRKPIKHLQKTRIKPVQFNWSRHWSKKVAPFLHEELVQACLDMGMRLLDPDWKSGDAPCSLGAIGFKRIVPGKLSWYQPLNPCHNIAFFAFAIGVLNYPELHWRFVSGDRHTVVVGYGSEGEPRIVMDILLFEYHSAEKSIALAKQDFEPLKPSPKTKKHWELAYQLIESHIGPGLRTRAQEMCQSRGKRKKKGVVANRCQPGRERHGCWLIKNKARKGGRSMTTIVNESELV